MTTVKNLFYRPLDFRFSICKIHLTNQSKVDGEGRKRIF